jgi:kynurenine formamidase
MSGQVYNKPEHRGETVSLSKSIQRASLALLLSACVSPVPDDSQRLEDRLADQVAVVAQSLPLTPAPPWPAGDERGMANALGTGTWLRCAYHLSQPDAQIYELSFPRSNDMPQSPWGPPVEYAYRPTMGVPGSISAWHPGDLVTGEPGAQGTQMDAFGHWGYMDQPWDGESEFPTERVRYYSGFTQADVKPSPESPLLKLGIDKASPILTSAVLLDAKTHLGGGEPMAAGQQITAADIEQIIEAQGLVWRGLLPGDVLYVYTGWSDYWTEDFYYDAGPGLSYDAAKYLESKRVVLVALDNPFTDAVNEGQFFGGAAPPPGTPEGLSTPVHYHNLTQAGIHNIQNANLAGMARDRVWTSCTIILPLRVKGGSGSPVRPVAIGASVRSPTDIRGRN